MRGEVGHAGQQRHHDAQRRQIAARPPAGRCQGDERDEARSGQHGQGDDAESVAADDGATGRGVAHTGRDGDAKEQIAPRQRWHEQLERCHTEQHDGKDGSQV